MGVISRARQELGFIKGNLLVLVSSNVLFGFTSAMWMPFRSLYIRELGASPLTLGLLSSLSSILLGFVKIPGAYIADRYGRRKVIAVFTYTAAFSYIFYVIAPDWRMIAFAITVSSLSHIYQPALQAIEADSMPPGNRGLGYSLMRLLPMLPGLVGPLVSGLIVVRFGLVPGMRVIYAAVVVVSMFIAYIRDRYLVETMDVERELGVKELAASMRMSLGSVVGAWRGMGRDTFSLTAVFLLLSFERPLFDIYYALFALDVIQVSKWQWSIAATVGTAAMLLLTYPLGKLIDGVGRRKMLLAGYLVSTPMLLWLTRASGFTMLVVINLGFQVFNAMVFPAYNALQADIVPKEKRGRVIGLIGTLSNLAMVPAAGIFGYLYGVNPRYPFYAGVVVEVATVLIILLRVREPEQRQD